MRSPSILTALLLATLALAATPSAATSNLAATLLTADEAVSRALAENREVRAAEAEVASAQAAAGVARVASYNPELEVASGLRSYDGQPVDLEVSVSQELEVAGQRRLRGRVAEALLGARRARRDHVRARVATETQVAFVEALVARDRVELADETVGLAARLHELADRRFEAGAIPVLERNLARVRVGEARRARLAAERALAEALAAIRALIAWPTGHPLEPVGQLPREGWSPVPVEELVTLARERRRDLAALRHAREAAVSELRLARAEGRSNLRFTVGWEREEGIEDWRIGVGVALPIFQRNQAGFVAGQAALEQAALELASAEVTVAQDVERAVRALEIASEDHAVFDEDVLAHVEQNLGLLEESFAAGKISLLQLLPLQAELVNLRDEHLETLATLAGAHADLALAVGLQQFPVLGASGDTVADASGHLDSRSVR